MKFYLLTILFIITFHSTAYLQINQNKVAVIVGISNYEFAGQLRNTINDANDIALRLDSLRYDVIKLIDIDLKRISHVIDSVSKAIKKDDVFLFYFSGHGAEYNGDNFLFLKNSHPTSPSDMPFETYPLGKILGKIDFYEIKTNIILLDACRSNPFVKAWNKNGVIKEGLANVNAPSGTFIGYAASPGKTASDGVRKNGTYTEAILKYINTKNITIDQLFNKVNKEVRTQSQGLQIPFKNSSLEDDFYFVKTESLQNNSESKEKDRDNKFVIAPINRPKFPLPKTMKGYHNETINSFALASINKNTFDKNEFIELSLNLSDENIWDKTTPIYVNMIKRNTTNSNGYMIYQEQFQPSTKSVLIKIGSSFEPGEYELTFGFHLVNELNQEYPAFYSKKYKIVIH